MSHVYMMRTKKDKGATKTFRWRSDGMIEKVSGYSAGKYFDCVRVPREGDLGGLRDLYGVLEEARSSPEWFLVRGSLRSGQSAVKNVNRRYLSKHDDPHWEPCDQRWVMLDIDGMDLPGWVGDMGDVEDQKAVVRWVIHQLPQRLHDVSCIYQWSSSAGLIEVDDGVYEPGWDSLRLHLWYWLDRAVCSASVRRWVKEVREDTGVPVDWAPFNPVQPHYVADPVFVGGEDVLDDRLGAIGGDVTAVEAPAVMEDLSTFSDRRRQGGGERFISFSGFGGRAKAYAQAALKSACENIRSAPEGERHFTLFSEAAGVGGLIRHLDERAVVSQLVKAGKSVLPPSRHDEVARTVIDGIETGEAEPRQIPSGGEGGNVDRVDTDTVIVEGGWSPPGERSSGGSSSKSGGGSESESPAVFEEVDRLRGQSFDPDLFDRFFDRFKEQGWEDWGEGPMEPLMAAVCALECVRFS